MHALLVALAAAFGVAIGAFLTVVIDRVPRALSVWRPRPGCSSCGAPIRPRHLAPIVSYLILRGRCADCSAQIPARYPLVEALGGALFAAVTAWALSVGKPELLPVLLYLAAVGLALAAIDIDLHRLPNALVLPSYLVVAAALSVASAATGDWWSLARAAFGAAALFGFYLLLAVIHPAGMGFGDVKLAGVLGAVTGYIGWAAVIVGAFAGFVFGALIAIGMIIARRGTASTALPFGPFMLAGAATGVVTGTQLTSVYWGVLGV